MCYGASSPPREGRRRKAGSGSLPSFTPSFRFRNEGPSLPRGAPAPAPGLGGRGGGKRAGAPSGYRDQASMPRFVPVSGTPKGNRRSAPPRTPGGGWDRAASGSRKRGSSPTRRAPPPSGSSADRQPEGPRTRRRSEEHTSELQSRLHLVCRLLLEKKKNAQLEHHPLQEADLPRCQERASMCRPGEAD